MIKKSPGKEVSPAMRRNYSDNEKGAALAFVDFTQGNTRQASKVLGIPHTTLADWAASRAINAEVTEIRTHKKKEIADLIEDGVRDMLQSSIGKGGEANLQQIWTAVGIGIDKLQILKGAPVSITKDVTNTERTNRDRARELIKLIRPPDSKAD
jgi:hypothetical protein